MNGQKILDSLSAVISPAKVDIGDLPFKKQIVISVYPIDTLRTIDIAIAPPPVRYSKGTVSTIICPAYVPMPKKKTAMQKFKDFFKFKKSA